MNVLKKGVYKNGNKIIKTRKTSERSIRTEAITLRFLRLKNLSSIESKFDFRKLRLIKDFMPGSKNKNLSTKKLNQIVKHMVKLHRVKTHKFGRIGINKTPRQAGDFGRAYSYFCNLLIKNGASLQDINQIKKLNIDFSKLPSAKRKDFSLIHRDLNPNNILTHKNQVNFIDYGSSATWDPALDLAIFLHRNKLSQNKIKSDFVLSKYSELMNDVDIQKRVELYLPLVYISQKIFC